MAAVAVSVIPTAVHAWLLHLLQQPALLPWQVQWSLRPLLLQLLVLLLALPTPHMLG